MKKKLLVTWILMASSLSSASYTSASYNKNENIMLSANVSGATRETYVNSLVNDLESQCHSKMEEARKTAAAENPDKIDGSSSSIDILSTDLDVSAGTGKGYARAICRIHINFY